MPAPRTGPGAATATAASDVLCCYRTVDDGRPQLSLAVSAAAAAATTSSASRRGEDAGRVTVTNNSDKWSK